MFCATYFAIQSKDKLYNKELIFCWVQAAYITRNRRSPVAPYKLQKKLNSMHTVQNVEAHCFTAPSATSLATIFNNETAT